MVGKTSMNQPSIKSISLLSTHTEKGHGPKNESLNSDLQKCFIQKDLISKGMEQHTLTLPHRRTFKSLLSVFAEGFLNI
jgi:hypothetical protein